MTIPAAIPQPRDIVLERAETMSPTVRALTFRVEDGNFCFDPGQWVSLCFHVNGERMIRAYSIASPPRNDNTFDLAITQVPAGDASAYLSRLAPGTRLTFTGPFGTFLIKEPINRPIYLVATGTGVAPFRAMLHDLLERRKVKQDIHLFLGARTEADILYREEFEERARRHPNFHFIPSLSRPTETWTGARGYVQFTSEPHLTPRRDADIYVCGVRKMVNDMRHHLREWGYDRKQIHYERYD